MDSNTIAVRPATIADAVGIARVHIASWQFAYRGILPADLLDSLSLERRTAFWKHGVTHPLPRAVTLVAVHGNHVVGCCSCGPVLAKNTPRNRAEVAATYVDPGSTRMGIGRRLMNAALEHLAREGFTEAILWALEDNPIARQFYERYGWSPTSVTRTETFGSAEVAERLYRIDREPPDRSHHTNP